MLSTIGTIWWFSNNILSVLNEKGYLYTVNLEDRKDLRGSWSEGKLVTVYLKEDKGIITDKVVSIVPFVEVKEEDEKGAEDGQTGECEQGTGTA